MQRTLRYQKSRHHKAFNTAGMGKGFLRQNWWRVSQRLIPGAISNFMREG